jgi:hypothetical protein
MARIARLQWYPIKGFDGVEAETVELSAAGTVAGDREFALCDPAAGETATVTDAYNGKQIERIHRVRTGLDPTTGALTVAIEGERRQFDLATPEGRAAANDWFGETFDEPVDLRRRDPPGFVDRPDAGPSVVSTATLEEVASWFDELTVAGVRRRLRANVEVSGVPAFWEDRFVGDDAPAFVVGDDDVRFEGVEPCVRCVVPTRDPETGDPLPRFRERFVERREATFPPWADRDAFPHWYAVMLVSRVPEASRGRTIRVGDAVRVVA